MNKEKMAATLEKIEKLIIDGQQEILEKISENAQRIDQLDEKLGGKIDKLDKRIDRLEQKVDRIDQKHDTNTQALYDLLQDTNRDVKRIEEKLDKHCQQPVHA
ncbi:hypothetical protein A2291_06540 [candidate division WOR-1 bacterium RIFOXYB2_FULL_42_35]|uniref:t-SNARE coiled-coil homology domain-containing protein n=1 Tax=candidate division WOR-1 bacterium RIFOXYC2_FULL_41_25 TaxID=1802586 RepID=A0A1F4TPD6_UNCSA|nr:MAG: hypothetical protein A2291_06540 [candidate division WOR-1 bacterium RIFOXYB2_FULL_42_35]OGC24539.1 MAG: hypothetical protein A2247_06320 [candidate division WOR-1 bacterium RIFOXYA2_FULL_41_14]OGC34584.1 MAG: hypothetical protein A2462_04555 [candidate division WOR-1 bacterium RIFOXYC2_FULL_41_25]